MSVYRRIARSLPMLLLVGSMIGGAGSAELSAQDAAQRQLLRQTGQSVSSEEILNRLAQSGLSRDEVRRRLVGMGLDPSMADPYFDRLEGEEGGVLGESPDFLQALAEMGILNDVSLASPWIPTPLDSLANVPDSVVGPDRPPPSDALPVFGQSVFVGATNQFEPLVSGPIDPEYTLGPGDQLQLILTGDVEFAYNLDVTREGYVIIPDVGQVSVNGLTLEQLREVLFTRLGRVYSGVTRSENATTTFLVSLGRLRTNQVYLVGEVDVPGAYQVSSAGTAFNALYAAGGPNDVGSMRSIQINRRGREPHTLDLYDYLLNGRTERDLRLEQGDVVFVPLAGPRVSVTGSVRRPAIYETQEDERISDLVRFAGGILPDGDPRRVQVHRVLPPAERSPARERVLVDVDLTDEEAASRFRLLDGDSVVVGRVADRLDGMVMLEGHVYKPGTFELTPGLTVSELVGRGGGLLPDAFNAVAHLIRLQPTDSTYVLERVRLGPDGRPTPDVSLRELDRVVIYGQSQLRAPAFVSIGGEVQEPGVVPLIEGMSAEDLLLAAGGFTARADPMVAQLVRRTAGTTLTDTIALAFDVSFGRDVPSALDLIGPESTPDNGGRRGIGVAAATVTLQDGDRLFVRRLQGLRDEGDIEVSGEVLYPGPYALEMRGTRVSDVLRAAGGLTSEAYVAGSRLVRGGLPVGLDLERALSQPGGEGDVLLQPDDRLEIPKYDATVRIVGAVEFQSRARWVEGLGLGDYLDQAGGVTVDGNRGAVVVTYANGERKRSSRFLFIRNDPDVLPGSTISVPLKPVDDGGGFDVDAWLGRLVSFATILVAIRGIN